MSTRSLAAIIDIGSNSIRLVVYNGPKRAPAVLFNEKVLAGLGSGLAETGLLQKSAMERALTALKRYNALIQHMGVDDVQVVATAAVRDAWNAATFLNDIAALGLHVDVLTGDQEAAAAGFGVISSISEADGIVGDLGGGSLELVRVSGGEVHERVSLPLGVLRSRALIAQGSEALYAHADATLTSVGWAEVTADLPFYLVGGSWRALARFHMRMTDYPLPVLHQYQMPVTAADDIASNLAQNGARNAKALAAISASRIPTISDAAALLAVMTRRLQSSRLVISAHGLREGLLFQRLSAEERARSPLIEAARSEGARQGRFPEHGDLLNAWIAPLFEADSVVFKTLRHAACLLADVSWNANPDFRAERGLDIALHGNWVGIDAHGRALVAQALFTGCGGGSASPASLRTLASAPDLQRAAQWGLAMRLGQRLSAGLAAPLHRTSLALSGQHVTLCLTHGEAGLLGDVIERRFKNVATALGVGPKISTE